MVHHEMTGRNHTERRAHRLLTVDDYAYIVTRVCGYYRVEKEQLWFNFKGNVTHDLSYRARQVIMYIAWVCYDTSFTDIAGYFNQHKSAAIRASTQVEDWRGAQDNLNAFIGRIEQDIIQRRITRAKHS